MRKHVGLTSMVVGAVLACALSASAANYTVVSGDSLWKIAVSHGVTVSRLMQLNGLTSTWIYPGQQLSLGGSPSGTAAGTYQVHPGDTMWIIAHKIGVGLQALEAANPQLVDPTWLYIGETLQLPGTSLPATGQPAPAPPSSVQQPVPPVNAGGSYEAQVLSILNADRQTAGLGALQGNVQLNALAEAKAKDLVVNKYFSHTSPTLGSPFDQLKNAGIRYMAAGENIAKGQRTPEQVMTAWMNSPGHRANILSSNYDSVGIGYYTDGTTTAWVQLFTGGSAQVAGWA